VNGKVDAKNDVAMDLLDRMQSTPMVTQCGFPKYVDSYYPVDNVPMEAYRGGNGDFRYAFPGYKAW
jgi:hypothetical protein